MRLSQSCCRKRARNTTGKGPEVRMRSCGGLKCGGPPPPGRKHSSLDVTTLVFSQLRPGLFRA